VSDKAQRTIRIKWVRSGIGFSYHQKRIVQSLGLKKLNQEVERPDTPQIRGLVAKVPHLVTIVEAPTKPAWKLVPEYTIYPTQAVPSKPDETALESPVAQAEKIEAPAFPVAPVPSPAEESAGGAGDATTVKSGIERHAEIVRSAQEDSQPANPSGEENGSSAQSQ